MSPRACLPICTMVIALTLSVVGPDRSAYGQVWRDTATGEVVRSLPVLPEPVYTKDGEYAGPRAVSAEKGDSNRAYDPKTGRNFFYDSKSCKWKDAKTGKVIGSLPVLPEPVYTKAGEYSGPRAVSAEIGDSDRAYDPKTGRNFVRVPCKPTEKAHKTTPPPKPKKKTVEKKVPANNEHATNPFGGVSIGIGIGVGGGGGHREHDRDRDRERDEGSRRGSPFGGFGGGGFGIGIGR